MITFAMFEDLNVKIDRPEEIKEHDSVICRRAYEKLKGVNEVDDWTRDADALFEKHNIKFEVADDKEFKEFADKANDLTLRI